MLATNGHKRGPSTLFKGEALAPPHEGLDSLDHEPTGGHGCTFEIERRQPARDLVGVDKLADAELRRNYGWGGGGFASAVRQ
jgi:hypothetical protein